MHQDKSIIHYKPKLTSIFKKEIENDRDRENEMTPELRLFHLNSVES